MTLTPAQEVAQKLAQLEAHSQAPAADAVAGTPVHTVAPAEAVPTALLPTWLTSAFSMRIISVSCRWR